eukprot:gene13248-15568_t
MSAHIGSSEESPCTTSESDDPNDIQWVRVRINDISLYGRFLRFAVIDGRPSLINNTLVKNSDINSTASDNPQGNEAESFIGINIPNYLEMVELDPGMHHSIVLSTIK